MHTDETATRADITLESSLLIGIKNVAGRGEKDHRAEGGEVLICEDARIFRGHDTEIVQRSQILDRLNSIRDGGVTERRCFRKNQDLEGSSGGGGERRGEEYREQRYAACATPCLCTTDAG